MPRGPGLVCNLGFDEPGADVCGAYGVGGYAEWASLQRGCFGQADEAVLGGGIGRFVGACGHSLGRGYVDDSSPAGGLHAGEHGLGKLEGRDEHHALHLGPDVLGEVFHGVYVLIAGVVDQHVDASVDGEGLLREPGNLVPVGQVCLEVGAADLFRYALSIVAPSVEDDARSRAG